MSEVLKELVEVKPLELLRTEIGRICESALQQRIGSQETKDAALQVGADVKRLRKALDERRKLITSPLQDTVKRVIEFANALDKPLEKAESHIRAQAVAYANEIAEEQRKARAALEMERNRLKREEETRMRNAAAMADTLDEQLQLQDQVKEDVREKRQEVNVRAQEVKSQGVKGTTYKTAFRVVDASLVPREFLVVNESLIRQAINYRHLKDIPGVEIFQETQVRLG